MGTGNSRLHSSAEALSSGRWCFRSIGSGFIRYHRNVWGRNTIIVFVADR